MSNGRFPDPRAELSSGFGPLSKHRRLQSVHVLEHIDKSLSVAHSVWLLLFFPKLGLSMLFSGNLMAKL